MTTKLTLMAWTLALLAASPVAAQTPPPKRVFTNRLSFSLPVKIDDRDRVELRELKFYAKTVVAGRASEWQCVESAPPTKNRFMFQAPLDGEYWFSFATVDRNGRVTPADLDHEPPGLIVIVDTKAPDIDVHKMTAATGESFLQCQMNDANPDYGKTRLEVVMPDRTVRTLEPIDDSPGVFRVTDPAMLKCVVRAIASDKAGNRAVREVDLNSGTPQIVLASAQSPAAPTVATPPALPIRTAERTEPLPQPLPTPAPALPAASSVVPPSGRHLLNGSRCSLEYAIDSPSVTRVEAYGTRDGGRAWIRLGDDPDRRSPIEFDLPEDGVYGISLVLSTGNRPGTMPSPGDQPDCWIEVDMTRPVVNVSDLRVGAGDDWGHLLMTWSAQDKNLAPDPVEILISAQPEGPWMTLARGQKPEGSAKIALPREMNGRVYVRLEARDLAGNCGRCDTHDPIQLDAGRPKARVLGVNSAGRR